MNNEPNPSPISVNKVFSFMVHHSITAYALDNGYKSFDALMDLLDTEDIPSKTVDAINDGLINDEPFESGVQLLTEAIDAILRNK